MIIQHNMLAMNANRQFGINTGKTKKTAEKLSSGYKINRAADDAAGLSISEKMRRQIRGLSQSAENIQDGIGYVQTADGALNEAHDILQRMNELAVKSANGTNTEEDREYIDQEVQQLKGELDRIFETTSFNDKLIWVPNKNERVQIGTEEKQAVRFTGSTNYPGVTNDNCDVLAYNGYKINADDQGVNVSWTGYDGNAYETKKIDWATLEANNYSFEMSDYFDKTAHPALFDTNDKPVLKQKVSFSVQETATIDDIIASINGCVMSHYEGVSMSGQFENTSGNAVSNDMSVVDESATYNAAYVSNAKSTDGRDFDAADDTYLEAADSSGNKLTSSSTTGNLISSPSATTVEAARNSTEGWKFSFYMEGVGKVTAQSTSIDYWAPSDTSDDDETYWWDWHEYYSNGVLEREKLANKENVGTGTLGDVMSVLTGRKGVDGTPGLLTYANGGDADNGGYIEINFSLTSDQPYSSGSVTSGTSVGSFALQFRVDKTDTEDTVLQKIRNSLNGSTVLDFRSSSGGSDTAYIYRAYENTHIIDVPIWGGGKNFFVQAGTEAGEHINIQYDCLSVRQLGMHETNVLTVEDSEDAIDSIKSAIQTISSQRSDFGAYQNRLEHSYNVNKNTEENTQASESVIRDTDMAKTMMEHSSLNILLQAGQAMIAQANQSNQGVLQLLQ